MDGWMHGWIDGWMNGWMDGCGQLSSNMMPLEISFGWWPCFCVVVGVVDGLEPWAEGWWNAWEARWQMEEVD